MKSADIAVLTYNRRALLDTFMPSALDQGCALGRLIVIDNGSSDDTPAYVRERWPRAAVITNAQNRGVAVALNQGVVASSSEYVALVNNDVELMPGWLGALIEALDDHPDAASASGKLLCYYRRDVIDAAGDEIRHSGIGRGRGQGQRDRGQYEDPCPVFGACAGAALYRRVAFEDVGGFEETFFAYREDVDWALRSQLRAWSSWYVPTAVAYHMGSATTEGEDAPHYARLSRRNSLAVVVRAYPTPLLFRYLPNVIAFHLGWLALSVRRGTLVAHLGGIRDFLGSLSRLLAERRAIQAGRRVERRALEAVMGVDRR